MCRLVEVLVVVQVLTEKLHMGFSPLFTFVWQRGFCASSGYGNWRKTQTGYDLFGKGCRLRVRVFVMV